MIAYRFSTCFSGGIPAGCGESSAAVGVLHEPELGQCLQAVRGGELPGSQLLAARLHPHAEGEAVLGDVAAGDIGVAVDGDVRPQLVQSVIPLLLVQ